jgi:hypothetical protein
MGRRTVCFLKRLFRRQWCVDRARARDVGDVAEARELPVSCVCNVAVGLSVFGHL